MSAPVATVTDPTAPTAPTATALPAHAPSPGLGSAWMLSALQRTVLGPSPLLSGTAVGATTQGWRAVAPAEGSLSRPSPGGSELPKAPGAPGGGGSGSGPSPSGGFSLSWLAVLMALAGLAALLFERLVLAPAAWRSVALVALLERPG